MDGKNTMKHLILLKKKQLTLMMSLFLLLSLMLTSTAIAQDRVRKLTRGIANTLTGWVEIPKNIYDTTVEEGVVSGCTKGGISGLGMAIVRTGCGVYEVVTSPFPVPEAYEPILLPEFVIEFPEYVAPDTVGLDGNKTYRIGDNEYEEI
jgi:putative exosortase-associated protein (TIGR04073 family)